MSKLKHTMELMADFYFMNLDKSGNFLFFKFSLICKLLRYFSIF